MTYLAVPNLKLLLSKLSSEIVKNWTDSIPLKRGGTASDVANLSLFLASDMSDYINGETIHVNGGMYMS